jgi:hypothetical protein
MTKPWTQIIFCVSQLRMRIELAFGLLNAKWRILGSPLLQVRVKNIGKSFVSITRLHNYCLLFDNIVCPGLQQKLAERFQLVNLYNKFNERDDKRNYSNHTTNNNPHGPDGQQGLLYQSALPITTTIVGHSMCSSSLC